MTIQTEPKTVAEQESCDHVKTVVFILPRNPDGQGHEARHLLERIKRQERKLQEGVKQQ